MQVLMFLLSIVGNMQNMQYNMQQYAKYANTISICRIRTPHFADGWGRAAEPARRSVPAAVQACLGGPSRRDSDVMIGRRDIATVSARGRTDNRDPPV